MVENISVEGKGTNESPCINGVCERDDNQEI